MQGFTSTERGGRSGAKAPAEFATPGSRLLARLIDGIIGVPVVVVLYLLASEAVATFITIDSIGILILLIMLPVFIMMIIGVVVSFVYEVPLIAVKGQTVGKMVMKIKVVPADDSLEVGFKKSLVRWIVPQSMGVVPIVGSIPALLGYAWIIWDTEHQGWHDKAAKTYVIKV